ncbi:glycoside hydrolase family 3 protein [[Clostridium] symbiosum]|uniref:glycoside hydrolase family 3 protein n=1 Tax=Clostridium symbiosum TaxID=1512 RepID=UPI001D07AD2E|nr:glycoside hydrolase family 3 protein [[Clostridium] symbiosum]MCB6611009.1 glycoside hydrolase family 3 protein [[Clostridium] symbiosum]MCB6931527.1 glycoside hydrolase family 3 protein [[Clostridium] symbiosum]
MAVVLIHRHTVKKDQELAAARESSAAVGTEVFPGDEKNGTGDGSGGSAAGAEEKPPTVEEIMARMTLEEKALQLFMVTPEALTEVDEVYAAGAKTEESINRYPVGGIVYFKQNLRSPEQVKDMLTRTQKYFRNRIGVEAFLAVDEEGGQVARISGREEFGIASFPDMREIGASGDPNKAYEVGDKIGTYLADLGFNMDFAPVADVLTNPENTVVARRSFGTDGAVTAAFSNEVVKGLQAHGISAVLKHFPGHGGTAADSHEGYASTERTLEELTAEDFVPFKEGADAGAHFIMSGHIAAPAVTGDNTPASLSSMMLTEILRGTLGYNEIIITDALNMGAVISSYSPAEAAVKALQAGNDMLLMPENFKEAYQGVLDAVHDGRLSEERIDQSVERILRVKLN